MSETTKNNSPTEDVIREYLLGRLDGQDERERQLSTQMFLNDELSEIADSIEDEIIEDYLDDVVNAADRRAIEEYFLRPYERRKKLELALTLRNYLGTETAVLGKKKLTASRQHAAATLNRSWFQGLADRSYFRTYCEIAAAVLIVVTSLLYMSIVSHRLQSQLGAAHKNQAQTNEELARARQYSATLEQRLQAIPPAVLVFVRDHYRQVGTPAIEIKPWTQRIRVEIELPSESAGPYDVLLETKNHQKTIWSQTRLAASADRLRFEVPAVDLSSGDYCILVGPELEHYCFQARLVQ